MLRQYSPRAQVTQNANISVDAFRFNIAFTCGGKFFCDANKKDETFTSERYYEFIFEQVLAGEEFSKNLSQKVIILNKSLGCKINLKNVL